MNRCGFVESGKDEPCGKVSQAQMVLRDGSPAHLCLYHWMLCLNHAYPAPHQEQDTP